tara:strand:- start:90 stop:923 length:834 start_codon:yes stop_codon:yes gene_type:complete
MKSINSRKVAFVTGASRGIGKASAIALAKAGFDVAISARTMIDGEGRLDINPDLALPGGLNTTLEAIKEQGVDGHAVYMDVTDRESVKEAVASVLERFEHVDVLMNNAICQGHAQHCELVDIDENELRKLFEGNLFSHLAITKALLPNMIEKKGGIIINMISSTAFATPSGRIGKGGWGMGYAMTKAAFARVAPLLMVELAHEGIRTFSIDPGSVITEKWEIANRGKGFDETNAGTPDMIGAAVAWLASSDEAHEYDGKVVLAQKETKKRDLILRYL